jgi:hypothetical protein
VVVSALGSSPPPETATGADELSVASVVIVSVFTGTTTVVGTVFSSCLIAGFVISSEGLLTGSSGWSSLFFLQWRQ